MANLFTATLLLAGLTLLSNSAQATVGSPLWGCVISAELENDSLAIGIGYVDKSGMAVVRCTSLEHVALKKRFSKKVYVEIEGPAVGLDLNFIKSSRVFMLTGSIGVRHWQELLGSHTLGLNGHVNALFVEGGLGVAVEFSRHRLLALQGSAELSDAHGLGASISVQTLHIYDIPQD